MTLRVKLLYCLFAWVPACLSASLPDCLPVRRHPCTCVCMYVCMYEYLIAYMHARTHTRTHRNAHTYIALSYQRPNVFIWIMKTFHVPVPFCVPNIQNKTKLFSSVMAHQLLTSSGVAKQLVTFNTRMTTSRSWYLLSLNSYEVFEPKSCFLCSVCLFGTKTLHGGILSLHSTALA